MTRFRFRTDDVLENNNGDKINLMVLSRGGTRINYLGRRKHKNGYVYAYVMWDSSNNEFKSSDDYGVWYAHGFSYTSFHYVATWESKVPDFAKEMIMDAQGDE